MDEFGICMTCAAKNISSGFMHIGPKTFGIIQETIVRLLNKNRRSIDAAYTANENDLTISISVNLKPHQTGNIIVKTGINFVESRVKESLENLVDEKQMKLFNGEKHETTIQD